MTTTTQEQQSVANLYRLLSRLWLYEVDEAMLHELTSPSLQDAFVALGGSIPDSDSLEQLAIDYCRIFIGPKNQLPPLQSVWHSGQLQSEITDSVRLFAELFGCRLEADAGMPDHLGVQLSIMGQAIGLPASEVSNEARRTYFLRHLTWPDRLFDEVLRRDESEFYSSLVRITRDWLRCEKESLR